MLFFIYQTGKTQQVYVEKEMSKKAFVHCWYEYKWHTSMNVICQCVLFVKSYKSFMKFLLGIYPIDSDMG